MILRLAAIAFALIASSVPAFAEQPDLAALAKQSGTPDIPGLKIVWLSPWVEGGKFCGSRGMALPLLGLSVRLKGTAAKAFECSYSATFVDGSAVGQRRQQRVLEQPRPHRRDRAVQERQQRPLARALARRHGKGHDRDLSYEMLDWFQFRRRRSSGTFATVALSRTSAPNVRCSNADLCYK